MSVRFRDIRGNIDQTKGSIIIHASDATIAEPQVGANTYIYTGKHKGRSGIIEVSKLKIED